LSFRRLITIYSKFPYFHSPFICPPHFLSTKIRMFCEFWCSFPLSSLSFTCGFHYFITGNFVKFRHFWIRHDHEPYINSLNFFTVNYIRLPSINYNISFKGYFFFNIP
jgi:hypothetical protein